MTLLQYLIVEKIHLIRIIPRMFVTHLICLITEDYIFSLGYEFIKEKLRNPTRKRRDGHF